VAVIGVGIDLVDLDRAQELLVRHGERALARFLLPEERDYVTGMPVPARHFAVRIAAKEAVYKAFQQVPGAEAIGWQDIEVERAESGRPGIALHGRARVLAEQAGVRVLLSLSHTDRTAGAVAVLVTAAGDA
jgi:holo-[acyl-carrier protein] synthase